MVEDIRTPVKGQLNILDMPVIPLHACQSPVGVMQYNIGQNESNDHEQNDNANKDFVFGFHTIRFLSALQPIYVFLLLLLFQLG